MSYFQQKADQIGHKLFT